MATQTIPLLDWMEQWRAPEGRGVVAGLVDGGYDETISDLVGAELVARDFTGSPDGGATAFEHGTYSVTMLVGQGRHQIRGLAPRARLLVAKVVNVDGIATPQSVADAVDWLVSCGAQIVAVPLGESVERPEIVRRIEQGSERGVIVVAAAGNGYPDQVAFPARHPLAVAVGAADANGHLLPECSRLPRLDLVAPGCGIPALVRRGVIRRRRGSSVACVIAAGVAALALSAGAIAANTEQRSAVVATLRRRAERPAPFG